MRVLSTEADKCLVGLVLLKKTVIDDSFEFRLLPRAVLVRKIHVCHNIESNVPFNLFLVCRVCSPEEVDELGGYFDGPIVEIALLQDLNVLLPLAVGDVYFEPVLVEVEIDVFEDVEVVKEEDDFDDRMAVVVGLGERIAQLLYGNVVLFIELLRLCDGHFSLFLVRNL